MKRIHRLRLIPVALLTLATALPGAVSHAAPVASHSNAAVTLRFAYFGGPDSKKLIDQILPTYHKAYPNVTVNLEPFPDSRVKVLTQTSAGTAADVYMAGDGDIVFLATRGALVDLKPLAQQAHFDLGQYLPGTLTIGSIGSHVYSLPKDYSPLAVYYNKALLQKAGVPFPSNTWTWTDFRNDALKLTKGGIYGATLSGDWPRLLDPFVRSFGGQLVSSDGRKVAGYMDSPATIKAVQLWIDLFRKDKIAPTPTQSSALGSDPFASGKAAMNLTGVWPSLGPAGYKAKPPFSFGVAPFPRGTSSAHVNTICYAGFVMSKATKHPNEAFALIRYLSGPVGDTVWSQNGLPSVRAVAQAKGVFHDPVESVFLKEVGFANLPADTTGAATEQAVGDTLTQGLDLLLNNPSTPVAGVLKIEASKGQQILDKYYSGQ